MTSDINLSLVSGGCSTFVGCSPCLHSDSRMCRMRNEQREHLSLDGCDSLRRVLDASFQRHSRRDCSIRGRTKFGLWIMNASKLDTLRAQMRAVPAPRAVFEDDTLSDD